MTNPPENPYEQPPQQPHQPQPNPYAQQPQQQQPYQQAYPAYASQPVPQGGNEFNTMGLIALICGIVAIGVSWIPLFGWFGMIPAIAAIGFGIAGLVMTRYSGRRGLAITGLILGGVGFILAMVLPIFTGMWWVFNELSTYDYNTPSSTYDIG